MKDAKQTEAEIDSARKKYKSIPERGSLLYFVLADLAFIDPMYQYSLAYFINLFGHCIDSGPKSTDLSIRLATLLSSLTSHVFATVIFNSTTFQNYRSFSAYQSVVLQGALQVLSCNI